MNGPRLIPGLALSLTLVATHAHAAPPTADAVLCTGQHDSGDGDGHTHAYLSVQQPAIVPTVALAPGAGDVAGTVTVCQDAAKARCKSFPTRRSSWDGVHVNADGTLLLVGSDEQADKGLAIVNAATGKVVKIAKTRRGAMYHCGGGLWLGTTVLAMGSDCEEFDTRPYLANGKSGAYIAPLVGKAFEVTQEAVYALAQLDATHWAIAVHDDNNGDAGHLGHVYVIDVKTGKVKATISGVAGGKASIVEGAQTRTLDKLPTCAI